MAPSHGSQAVRIMVPGSMDVFGINSTGLRILSHRGRIRNVAEILVPVLWREVQV